VPTGRRRLTGAVFLAVGAVAELVFWLVTRPDTAQADGPLVSWLVLEAVAAVLIGCLAPNKKLAGWTVVTGWALQVLHYAVLVSHGEADNLWGVLTQMQLLCAALLLKLALVAHDVTARVRRRGAG
jgi:hypothetical protein